MTLLAKLFSEPEIPNVACILRYKLLLTTRLNTSTGLPIDTILLLKRLLQIIALGIQTRPSPSNNDPYTGQEYKPVIHRLHLFLRSHLRVASPAHDERGGGNRGHSVGPILTGLTLLIPASVPLTAPANLTIHLHCCQSTPLPLLKNLEIHVFGVSFEPR